ncbi:MAG: adenosine kinase [Pseudomonadales bacterium]|nr:adenosine kinase [Pseudomonadales bacterium]
MAKYDIYGVGAALVDTEIEVSDQFLLDASIDKGVMTLVDESRQHELMQLLQNHLVASKRASGGSAANSIIAASYLGASTFYSCKVGNDENGAFYLADLDAAGVAASKAHSTADGITGKCLVMITADAERSMNTYLGISETLAIDNLSPEAIKDSAWVYIEGYLVTSDNCRAAAIRAREVAESHGVKTALSLSDPGMVEFFGDGLKAMLGDGVDLLFCNEEEAKGFANSDKLEDAVSALKTVAKCFAITLGKQGALLFDGQSLIQIDPYTVDAIDTNGAGDAFAGAFLYAISQDYDFATAGKLASYVSAQVVSQFGPRLDQAGYLEALATIQSPATA